MIAKQAICTWLTELIMDDAMQSKTSTIKHLKTRMDINFRSSIKQYDNSDSQVSPVIVQSKQDTIKAINNI